MPSGLPHGMHIVRVAMKLCDLVVSGNVPQADRFIPAGGGQPGAVRAKGQAVNGAAVTENSEFLMGSRAPEPNGEVIARRGNPFAIPAVADAADTRLMPAEYAHLPSGGHIPEPDRPIPLGGCQLPSIRAKGDVCGTPSRFAEYSARRAR